MEKTVFNFKDIIDASMLNLSSGAKVIDQVVKDFNLFW